MSITAMKSALSALENSVDLVINEHYQYAQNYGRYPSREGKIAGLKKIADDHQAAITALREWLAAQS